MAGGSIAGDEPESSAIRLAFPHDAAWLMFAFEFINRGDGDWVTLHFGDLLLWSFLGTNYPDTGALEAMIPVHSLGGDSGLLQFRLNSVGESNASFRFGDLRFESPVPEPTSLALLALGVGVLMRRRMRAA